MSGRILSVALALVAVSLLHAREPQDSTRGLTTVPAPVGPGGAMQELYAGSYALLVGVSRYDAPAAWAELESIPEELDSLAHTLRQVGFQQVEVIRNPTGRELKDAVYEFMRRYGYKADTRLFFFFAGHGYTLDGGAIGYFVPRDAPDPVADEPGFRAAALSMQQVNTWAGELVARHALFAFDSCFSGTVFRTRSRSVPGPITALTQKPVRQFFSAGGAGEKVPAKSVFTPMLIRGLNGAGDRNQDGFVTGSELFNYVQGEVLAYGTGQRPQYGTMRDIRYDEGDLVFVVPASANAATPAVRPSRESGAPPKPAATPTPAATDAASSTPPGSGAISTDMARKALASRNIAWNAAAVASALSSADIEVLDLFTKGGAEPGLVLEGLGSAASDGKTAAQTFFERTKANPRSVQWLRSALSAGLDPNATVSGANYKREGLLHAAVRAGNAPAILALLDAGGSPHAYQELFLTRYPNTRFLAPYAAIVDHEVLSPEEKKTIVERFIKLGAILPEAEGHRSTGTYQLTELKKVRSGLNQLGLTPPRPASLAAQSKPVCESLSKRDGNVNWCGVIDKMPFRILAQNFKIDWRENPPPPGSPQPRAYHDFFRVDVLGLMNVIDGRAQFLGVEPEEHVLGNFVVVEVSSDLRSWRVFRYMRPGAGLGLCQKEQDGSQPENCWRRISMTYHADKKQMMVEDYYPYDVFFSQK